MTELLLALMFARRRSASAGRVGRYIAAYALMLAAFGFVFGLLLALGG